MVGHATIKSNSLAYIPAGIHVPGGEAPEKSGQRTPEGFEVSSADLQHNSSSA